MTQKVLVFIPFFQLLGRSSRPEETRDNFSWTNTSIRPCKNIWCTNTFYSSTKKYLVYEYVLFVHERKFGVRIRAILPRTKIWCTNTFYSSTKKNLVYEYVLFSHEKKFGVRIRSILPRTGFTLS